MYVSFSSCFSITATVTLWCYLYHINWNIIHCVVRWENLCNENLWGWLRWLQNKIDIWKIVPGGCDILPKTSRSTGVWLFFSFTLIICHCHEAILEVNYLSATWTKMKNDIRGCCPSRTLPKPSAYLPSKTRLPGPIWRSEVVNQVQCRSYLHLDWVSFLNHKGLKAFLLRVQPPRQSDRTWDDIRGHRGCFMTSN